MVLISGVSVSSMAQQQFHHGLITRNHCSVKQGALRVISGVGVSSTVQEQLRNGHILCKVKRGLLVNISGVDFSSTVQQSQ